MSKIRVLPDQIVNQIAAGEVVERPASVAKELVENAIDAGATRISLDVEAGGRRLLKVSDDGEGMTRDDAVLAFERHATSKISRAEDLAAIGTLGFRGEALASIASVARIELVSNTEDAAAGTRVVIEGGRMRDVKDAAHPRGTTLTMRDLFFNVPARRKFLRSEATESFHLTNLVTHYALAHPEIAFTLTNNGREILRAPLARDLRERAYQIFGAEFLENLLEVDGGNQQVARVRGFVSAPRDRRTSRDAQYLFVNGRFVRDRLISRALSEGYRAILPHGVYPAALLFLETPLEEVDVNVHPAKTEVRFRRNAAVADAVREAVRAALASGGHVRAGEDSERAATAGAAVAERANAGIEGRATVGGETESETGRLNAAAAPVAGESTIPQAAPAVAGLSEPARLVGGSTTTASGSATSASGLERGRVTQPRIDFPTQPSQNDEGVVRDLASAEPQPDQRRAITGSAGVSPALAEPPTATEASQYDQGISQDNDAQSASPKPKNAFAPPLPPLVSADKFVREVPVESLSPGIRPLGQLDESFIIATDEDGLLLIDQHVAHERILFDKYRNLEATRVAESQRLLIPETFDLTPAQAAVFDSVAAELERTDSN